MRDAKIPITAAELETYVLREVAKNPGMPTSEVIEAVTAQLPEAWRGDPSLTDRIYKRLHFMGGRGELEKERRWNGQGTAAYWNPVQLTAEERLPRSDVKRDRGAFKKDFGEKLQLLLEATRLYHRAIEGHTKIRRGRHFRACKDAVLECVEEALSLLPPMSEPGESI